MNGTAEVKEDTSDPESDAGNKTITDDEKAIYDRQIRLWGLEAQNRLRNSNVLIAGLSGCGAEVAKNLMLAGVKSLTLLDSSEVTKDEECCQFLIPNDSIGENRAEASRLRCQMLNPNVDLVIDTDDVTSKGADFFKKFDLVVLIDQNYSVVEAVNKICREANIRFEAGGVFGWVGYGFFDFNNHVFLINAPKSDVMDVDCDITLEDGQSPSKKAKIIEYGTQNGSRAEDKIVLGVEEDEKIKTVVNFPSWREALNVDWTQKKLIRKVKRILPKAYFPVRALLRSSDNGRNLSESDILKIWEEEMSKCSQNAGSYSINEDEAKFYMNPQLSPACAVVGAVIAQEAIKALSQNDVPLQNLFVYSALDTTGVVCQLPPPF